MVNAGLEDGAGLCGAGGGEGDKVSGAAREGAAGTGRHDLESKMMSLCIV